MTEHLEEKIFPIDKETRKRTMRIHRLPPSFEKFSPHARIRKAHHALGSAITDVAMPEFVRIDPKRDHPFTGAFSGLNEPQFRTLGTDICVGKFGYVTERQREGGATFLKVAVPVYSALRKGYKGMLFVNLATSSEIDLDSCKSVEVVPSSWANAVEFGEDYWLIKIDLPDFDPECNPFDYAQAFLPSPLVLSGDNQAISTAGLCEFYSEVFRFLEPCDRTLYLEIMSHGNRFTKFLTYAASTRSHHCKEHGLFLHTAETVANVLLTAISTSTESQGSRETPFDLSLTLLAALLHDAAKVDDYHRLAPDVYSTNLNCNLIGHEQTMLKWIAVACAVSGCYSVERELQLEHAICAVKKQHDQSGARKRRTIESFVLHDADCASARDHDQGRTSVLLAERFVAGEAA